MTRHQSCPANPHAQVPYWRLSSFYLFYFVVVGIMVPFWSLYLRQMGFSLVEIGALVAIQMSTRLVAPNLWGWLSDRTNKRLLIIRMGTILGVGAYAGVFFQPAFWGMALVMAGFNFFWNAILPQFEVITLQHLRANAHQYSRIRLWGSIGFIIGVVGLGAWFEQYSVTGLPLIVISFMGLILIAVFAITQPAAATQSKGNFSAFLQQVRTRTIWGFFLLCFFMQMSHGPYYTFYSIFLQDAGYSNFWIGNFWALGVLAEIVIFLFMPKILGRFDVRTLAVGCLLIGCVRWWLTATYPDHVGFVLLAQLGHAATFGIFHALAMHLMHQYFSPEAAGQGQAFYSAFCYGAGNAAGAFLSGLVVSAWGGSMAYYGASALLLMAAVLAWFLLSGSTKH